MDKKGHIRYWVESSKDDLKTVEALLKGKRYVHAMFFGHLYLEKISKAVWVKDNESNHPPRIHNINRILQQTKTVLKQEEMEFVDLLNEFQLEGRYPDYVNSISKSCTSKLTKEYIKRIKEIGKCVLKNLQ
jgi:HEPN domain-containing protein